MYKYGHKWHACQGCWALVQKDIDEDDGGNSRFICQMESLDGMCNWDFNGDRHAMENVMWSVSTEMFRGD